MKSLQAEQLNLNHLICERLICFNCNNYATLQSQIQLISETFTKVSSTKPSTTPEPPALSANSIADELADRKGREANAIVYNLPKLPDKSNDKYQYTDLCNIVTVFCIKVAIIKLIRLGKRQDNKARPFLITMENLHDEEIAISNSYLLHHYELYKTIYISPDKTKYQRNRPKQLVEELKRQESMN